MSDENESGNDDSDTRSTDTDHDHDLADLREDIEQNAESIGYLTDLLEKTADSVDDLAGVVEDLDTDESTDDALFEEPETLPEYR